MNDAQKNMNEGAYRIAYLISGFIQNKLTKDEHDELDSWVEASDENMLLFEELTDEKNIEANMAWMDKVRTEQMLQKTKEKIHFNPEQKPAATNRWIYSVAASVILLIAAFGIHRITTNEKSKSPSIAKVVEADVQPGGNKATLTLSDGSIIDLSNVKKGLLKNDNGAAINKSTDGEIVYVDSGKSDNKIVRYNVLSTPKGGQYQVQLPDGSKVWLNAASSLKYPTSFTGKERTVELRGEGYFEVTKNNRQPFKVMMYEQSEVKVLGTNFNVMSYEDEKAKDITLLEGSVRITSGNNNRKLEPGQQAKIISKEIKLFNSVDTEIVTGWKNGQFVFHDADIESIMRQVARWYDVEIKFKANINQHFNATIFRNEPVSRLLRILEQTGHVHFKIENKIIYVLP